MHTKHAVVVGASIAGMVAARILSDRFDHVTLVDRDELPETAACRAGVPQGRHGHGLLAIGFSTLTRLFPDLESDLLNAGAVPGDVIGDVRWFQHGYYKARFPSGLAGILLSRSLLESALRSRLMRLPNVTVLHRTHVASLMTDPGRSRLIGVRIAFENREPRPFPADLVIDTSGRSSRTPAWLEELGYAAPAVDGVEVDLHYTTRTFRRRPTDLGGDIGAILAPTPPHQKRVGFMLAMEGNRWIVTMGGWLGERAPADPRGFVEFAQSLDRPDIHDVIRDAEPLTDAVTFAFKSNLRHRYEHLGRFPDRYLVMGDAVCSFNPFYGQGMSVAALEGLALERCLADRSSQQPLWRRFFADVARIVDTPWTIAAGSDFAFDGVKGAKPAGTDLVNWYLNRVHRVASTDRTVCRTFFDVANLLKPAPTLFRPGIMARVAAGALRSDGRSRPVTGDRGVPGPARPRHSHRASRTS